MTESLESKLQRMGNPARMLRDSPSNRFRFDYPDQYTNWQEEQEAWRTTAVLFDQSHHMTDVYFRGPDVTQLLTDCGTNSFTTFARNKAKHYVTCAEDGHMIGTAVLFGLEDNEVSLVGPVAAANWVRYQAETGGYDVEVTLDPRTVENAGRRRTYRFEIEGPHTGPILDRVNGGPVDRLKFFAMGEFAVGPVRVRALSHTMAGVPGAESMGVEIWGPAEEKEACLEALLAAGEEYGLVRGGALAYYTGGIESGYAAQPTPAVYSGDAMLSYRQWLPSNGYEGNLSIGGSYASNDVEDFYVTPFDFGYGHLVRFDHDFIGRTELEKVAEQPHRHKVWLRWHADDVTRIQASSLFGGSLRAKALDNPLGRYARVQIDEVRSGDELAGISTLCAYTVNVGAWMSVGFVDERFARDGTELTVVWGEENGGTHKRGVERHTQTTLRATVSTQSLAAEIRTPSPTQEAGPL